ncbi:nucleotidyltransferase domain-containing protein [Stenotrophomonas sp. AB1(2024)]|uniref:nucleotidyltransferase domain-containing protein n=1 Tax=Stenotrophomonas sp. AB1(2024) TaxID=3132215 RepID=UPI0038FB4236
MHIYAFGSVCRGELDRGSDVDLLACVDSSSDALNPDKFSVYTKDRMREVWIRGNPFAWHLHLESKLIYSSDGVDFISALGKPARYSSFDVDSKRFKELFHVSMRSLSLAGNSQVFHLSCIFLALRNIATCYSVAVGSPVFSRYSPLRVTPSLEIDPDVFSVLMRSRLLSTRGYGEVVSEKEIGLCIESLADVDDWMERLTMGGLK